MPLPDTHLRVETNQTRVFFGRKHHLVALVDTGCAVDAFQLGAISYINGCGAYRNALSAIDAIALAFRAPGFSPFVVIGDHHRFGIEQHSLHPPIGTNHGADLLAEPAVYPVKEGRYEQHDQKTRKIG